MTNLSINSATICDIDLIIDLFYITETDPNYEWGVGSELEHKTRLKNLLYCKNSRFSLDNFLVLRSNDNFVGFMLLIKGNELKKLTFNSDKELIKFFPNIKTKFSFLFSFIHYMLSNECNKDEMYLSNIAIHNDFRGKHYSDILMNKAFEITKKQNFTKISLHANNDKLVEFYSKFGFILVDSKTNKMIKSI